MISYKAPAYRPSMAARPLPPRSVQHHQLGSLASMTAGDWGLLLGGAIVGGVGINSLYGQFTAGRGKMNAVSVLLGLVLAGVGLTLFVDKGGKAISSVA